MLGSEDMKTHVGKLQIYLVHNISERNLRPNVRIRRVGSRKTLAGSLYAHQAHAMVLCQRLRIWTQGHAMVSMRCSATSSSVTNNVLSQNALHRYLTANKKNRKGNKKQLCQTKKNISIPTSGGARTPQTLYERDRRFRGTHHARTTLLIGSRDKIASSVKPHQGHALQSVRRWASSLHFRLSARSSPSHDFLGLPPTRSSSTMAFFRCARARTKSILP
jgi:hypothetical protein